MMCKTCKCILCTVGALTLIGGVLYLCGCKCGSSCECLQEDAKNVYQDMKQMKDDVVKVVTETKNNMME